MVGLRKLDLRHNGGLTALPVGLGRLHNLEVLLLGCSARLAGLCDLERKEGLSALLAHLAGGGGGGRGACGGGGGN